MEFFKNAAPPAGSGNVGTTIANPDFWQKILAGGKAVIDWNKARKEAKNTEELAAVAAAQAEAEAKAKAEEEAKKQKTILTISIIGILAVAGIITTVIIVKNKNK